MRWARHPIVAFFTFNVVFSLAHVPAFYELTLANEALHAVEHLVFIGTAMLMWMPVLSPAPTSPRAIRRSARCCTCSCRRCPRRSWGRYCRRPQCLLPDVRSGAAHHVPLPLEDQQLGGLIMWVGSGVYFLIATGVVFFVWAGREEAANRRPVGVH